MKNGGNYSLSAVNILRYFADQKKGETRRKSEKCVTARGRPLLSGQSARGKRSNCAWDHAPEQ